MKNIFAICFFIPILLAYANCPKELSGTWVGTYTDQGPFGATIPITLTFQTNGNNFSGHSLPSSQGISLGDLSLHGSCDPKTITFYLSQGDDPKPLASELSFINPNQISIYLYWQTAMIGGCGPALLERKQS